MTPLKTGVTLAAALEPLIGGKPGIAADQDEFSSGRGLCEMSFNDRSVVHRQATDNFRDTAAQTRSCQIKRPIDCRILRHAAP
jgi:hypothetical protein